MAKLYLRQKFTEPVNGVMGAPATTLFDWQIEKPWSNTEVSRVGSWAANYFFDVATGKTDRATLGNARRALAARAKREEKECSFEYLEQ